jgi:hypothetical protein
MCAFPNHLANLMRDISATSLSYSGVISELDVFKCLPNVRYSEKNVVTPMQ